MPLDAQIEALLFWKGEAMSLKKLAEILKTSEQDIEVALAELEKKLEGRGVQLIRKEHEVMLGSRSEMGPVIEALVKEELVRDLGKAGLETLSIILYRGPVTRRDIDYIRGVNSQFILRNLLIRGLVEKVANPEDARTFLYKPTFELLAHMGLSSLEELPEFAHVHAEIVSSEHSIDAPHG
jgi:segregation and condensation protein B